MKDSDRYLKIVEWSEEDGVYVGTCPGLTYGGVHGKDERRVYAELCQVVDELVALHKRDGTPLPRPTAGWVTGRTESFAGIAGAIAAEVTRELRQRPPTRRKAGRSAASTARPAPARKRAAVAR